MENLKKVEKLREKANVSYEEAKAALEACDWDLLDAIVMLEAEGKVKSEETFTTSAQAEEEPATPQEIVASYENYQQEQQKKEKGAWKKLKNGIKTILRKSCDNHFVVKRHGQQILEMPVLVLAVLLLASVWTVLIVMAVGLFFGFSYGFSGPDLGKENINNTMGKATEMAEDIKNEFHHE